MQTVRQYKKPFSQFVKKQPRPFRAIIEDEVSLICEQPDIGEMKVGDLAGIRVHKFRFNRQEYLIAYHLPDNTQAVQILTIDFYQIGTHERFYEDLKHYLRASGWYA